MLTNLANELGHHLVEITEYHENIVGMRICYQMVLPTLW